MGLCHDFGSQITEHCSHPMRAGANACTCDQCGVVCSGLFDACSDVWARGPHPVLLMSRPRTEVSAPTVPVNGQRRQREADALLPPAPVDHPTNGAMAVSATSTEGARTEVFRWFEREFGAVRDEVAGLRAALAQDQAEKPDGETQAGHAGELAVIVDAAVAKAVANHLTGLEHSVTGVLKSLRRELKEARLSNERSVNALRDAIAESKSVPDSQLGPLADAVADSAAHSESLLTGLAEAVADSASQSAAELAALRRRLDRVTQAPAPQPSGAVMARLGLVDDPPPPPGRARSERGVRVSLRDHAAEAPEPPASPAGTD